MKPRKVKMPSHFSAEAAVAILKSLPKISKAYKTVDYVADRFGVSGRTMADWKSGKSKPPDTVLFLILYHILLQKDTPKHVKAKIEEFDTFLYMPISSESNFDSFIDAIR